MGSLNLRDTGTAVLGNLETLIVNRQASDIPYSALFSRHFIFEALYFRGTLFSRHFIFEALYFRGFRGFCSKHENCALEYFYLPRVMYARAQCVQSSSIEAESFYRAKAFLQQQNVMAHGATRPQQRVISTQQFFPNTFDKHTNHRLHTKCCKSMLLCARAIFIL